MKRRRPTVTLFAFQDIITAVTGIVILISLLLTLQLVTSTSQANPVESVASELELAIAATESRISSAEKHLNDLQTAMQEAAAAIPAVANRREIDLRQQSEILERDLQRLEIEDTKMEQAERDSDKQELLAQTLRTELDRTKEERIALEAQLKTLQEGKRRFYRFQDLNGRQAWLVEISGNQLRLAPVGIAIPPLELTAGSSASAQLKLNAWLDGRDTQALHLVLIFRPSGAEHFNPIRETLDSRNVSYGYDLIAEDEIILDAASGAANE